MKKRSLLRPRILFTLAALGFGGLLTCATYTDPVTPDNLRAELVTTTPADSLFAGTPLIVHFTINLPSLISSAVVSFGDDSTKTLTSGNFDDNGLAEIRHSYANPGTDTIKALIHLSNGTDRTLPVIVSVIKGRAPVIAPTSDTVRSVAEGGQFTLSFTTSTGTPPLTWKWMHGTDSVAVGASLSISSVKPTDAGIYYAIASNSSGSDTSQRVTLTILQAATFNIAYDGNGNTGGTAPTDANPYKQSASVTVRSNTGTLVKAGSTFAGWTMAADGSGTLYAGGDTLIIGAADVILFAKWTLDLPKITTPPANLSVLLGQTATFSVVATGNNLQYQWQKGASNISGATATSYTTPATTLADSGATFRCIISNSAGKDTSTAATLAVTTQVIAASIKTDPANQSVSLGATATFSVVATGTNPQYQWQKGTTDIGGATAASYTTPATTFADSGTTYRCIVSNSASKDTSTAATLTVKALIIAPVITTEPANQSVIEGSTATFSVTATGTNPQYQWQKGTTNIGGATAESYTTPATTLADSGTTFRCIASNSAGKDTSKAAKLSVSTHVIAPVVTTDPTDQSVSIGTTATFSVTATGTSPQYQWQKGTTDIGGATAASYTTPATTLADSGLTFRCIVSNAAGKDTSAAAKLIVNPPPVAPTLVSPADGATNQPVSLSLLWNKIVKASSYYVQVSADSGFSTTVVSDSSLTDTSKTVSSLSNGATLYWRVKAKNAAGASPWSSRRSFTTIIAAPTITTQPQSKSANKGGSVSLTVSASSTGLSYAWYKKGNGTPKSTSQTYALSSLAYADSGFYYVVVSNTGGSVGSDTTAKVTVIDNVVPTISLKGTADTTVLLGATYTDPGVATATDDRDGDVKASAQTTSNTVTIGVAGKYTVTWQVSDLTGNKNTASRIVRVQGWAPVGDVDGTDFSIAEAANGDLYLAYVDGLQNVKVKVCAAGSMTWTDLAGTGLGFITRVRLDMDKDRMTLYLFADLNLIVYKNGSWSQVAEQDASFPLSFTSLNIRKSDNAPLGYGCNRGGCGAQWVDVTGSPASWGWADYSSMSGHTIDGDPLLMSTDKNGRAYIFGSDGTTITGRVADQDSNWSTIVGNGGTTLYALAISQAKPYILSDYLGNPSVFAYVDTSTWTNLGSVKTGAISAVDLTCSFSDSKLYSGYIDGVAGKTDAGYVQVYNNGWQPFTTVNNGKLPVTNSATTGGKLQIQIANNVSYATYLKNGSKISTLKYVAVQ